MCTQSTMVYPKDNTTKMKYRHGLTSVAFGKTVAKLTEVGLEVDAPCHDPPDAPFFADMEDPIVGGAVVGDSDVEDVVVGIVVVCAIVGCTVVDDNVGCTVAGLVEDVIGGSATEDCKRKQI